MNQARRFLAALILVLAAGCGDDGKPAAMPVQSPAEPVALGQYCEDAITRIPKAGVTGEGSVVFLATLEPASAPRSVRLAVEVVPAGTPFTGAATAAGAYGIGGPVEVRVAAPAAGDYVWQAWAEDDALRASGPVSMPADGGRFTVDPSAPTRLAQVRLNGSSGMLVGAWTPEVGVVLRARVRSPLGEILRARFEVKPSSVPFDGNGVVLGTCVSSGRESEATAFLEPGPYHWRVRADHVDGSSSLWVGFGGNDDDVPDADGERIPPPMTTTPAVPIGLEQLHTDRSTPIPAGGTTAEDKVVVRGTVSGLAGLPCALEVEVKPLDQPFDATGLVTCGYVESGFSSRTMIPVASGAWHWQARTVDAYGGVSGWVAYNYYGTGGADFTVVPSPNTPPANPSGLEQYQLFGAGMAATDPLASDGMLVKAALADPDFGNGILLEIEVKRWGDSFTGVPSAAGSIVASGKVTTLTVTDLTPGVSYHWQARARDASGATSAWVGYGGSTIAAPSSSPSPSGTSGAGGGGYGGGCGLTGLDGLAMLALVGIARRRRGSRALHNVSPKLRLYLSKRRHSMNEKKGKKRFIISEQSPRTPAPSQAALPAPARRRSTPPEKPEAEIARESRTDRFAARDFTGLLGMQGFSNTMLENHFELYQGYVKNANLFLGELERLTKEDRLDTPPAGELRRRFGWEYDSIRLHEYYFENLTKAPKPADQGSRLFVRMKEDFGSFENWKKDFNAVGAMRGIGWVILYHDPLRNRLINAWITEHDAGHFVACTPILIMDVFEHAYMLDYGIKKAGYIDAFFKNLNWDVVTARMP
jgi:Fe-Mn family superoxide dismutase